MPVSEQKLSARLIVTVVFFVFFNSYCFLGGWGGEVVASILTGVHTYVRMVHARTCKCKLSISFNSLKYNNHSCIILGKRQQLLIPNAFRRMAIKY